MAVLASTSINVDYEFQSAGVLACSLIVRGTADVIGVSSNKATVHVYGTTTITNVPNVMPDNNNTSRFILLSTVSPTLYPFTEDTDYFRKLNPIPEDYVNLIFRIDYPTIAPHMISLWNQPDTQQFYESTATMSANSYPFDYTYEVQFDPATRVATLMYQGDGESKGTNNYVWSVPRTYSVTIPAPTAYRPGAVYNGTKFMSCNSTNGKCNIYNGTEFVEMTTEAGGTDNPPLIYTPNGWKNMGKSGSE